jgi:hypothetical protein
MSTIGPEYRDLDDIMLHSCFELLCKYVEIELASLNKCGKNMRFLFYTLGCWFSTRSREDGLEYLKGQQKMVYADIETLDKSLVGTPRPEALYAKKVEEIYLWWKDHRVDLPVDEIDDDEDTEQLKKLMDLRMGLWT